MAYSNSLRRGSDWSAGEDEEDTEGAENLDYDLNEDEDEFGLPSIANARRAARRAGGPSLELLQDSTTMSRSDVTLLDAAGGGRPRANSSDIAEERGVPSYVLPKKSEGKILRPQYKEILRGLCNRVLAPLVLRNIGTPQIQQMLSI